MENNSRTQNIITAIFLLALFAFIIIIEQMIKPTDAMAMLLTVLKKSSVYAIVAVSMNLLNGFTGLFSLGQAGFMLVGSYTYAMFTIPLASRDSVYKYYDCVVNISFPEILSNAIGSVGMLLGVIFALILAGLVAAGMAFLIGYPVLRLKSDYLAIATLGFAEIIRAIYQWGKLGPVTNGSNPLRNFVRLSDFKLEIGSTTIMLTTFTAVLIAVICVSIIVLLINSSYGRAFKAIREDEIAAEAMGINVSRHKQTAFGISCFFAGVGGGLFAMFANTVQANTFKSAMTFEILLIVIIGGIGSVSGSCIAALLFIFASEWWLRGLDSGNFMGISAPGIFRNGFRLLVFSVIILSVVLFFRRGLMGDKELPHTVRWIKKKFFTSREKAGEANG